MRIGLVLAMLLAAGLRLGWAWHMAGQPERQLPDSQLYQAYAEGLLDRGDFRVGPDRARRTPGYPVFIAACWSALGRSTRSILLVQAVLSTLTCLLAGDAVRRMTKELDWSSDKQRLAQLATTTACAVEPYLAAACALVLTESVFTDGLLLTLWLGLVMRSPMPTSRRMGLALLLGLTAGAGVLVKPSALLLLLVAGLLWQLRCAFPRSGLLMATATLGALTLLAPWWIRNAWHFGRFVPTTLNVGESLYDGLNPKATGGSEMSFTTDPLAAQLDEVGKDRHWHRAAKHWAKRHPGDVLKLAAIKCGRFWSPWPNDAQFRSTWIIIGTTTVTLLTWGLAILGLRALPIGWSLVLLAPTIYFCGLHLVFVSSVRYRIPTAPFLAIIAGVGAVQGWSWWRSESNEEKRN